MITEAEKLMLTTVRLECSAGTRLLTGTGFYFSFRLDDGTGIPVIVTNRHVIEGMTECRVALTHRNDEGLPIFGSFETIHIKQMATAWIPHPDPNVDLAVLPIASLLDQLEKDGIHIFFLPLDETFLPDAAVIESLTSIEDIVMVGYPNGLWDHVNNLPIVRHGITATGFKFNYCGNPHFVIDCACFPGSSGSPVLIFNQSGYSDAHRRWYPYGTRVLLLGVLFAGPQHIAEGEIRTIQRPFAMVPIALSKIPNNLGFVIKSEKLIDFKAILATNA